MNYSLYILFYICCIRCPVFSPPYITKNILKYSFIQCTVSYTHSNTAVILLTWGFCRMTLKKLKHIPTSFGNSSHLGYHWQVVDHKWYFILLMSGQILGMSKQSKASYISSTMSIVFVHQPSSWKSSHCGTVFNWSR